MNDLNQFAIDHDIWHLSRMKSLTDTRGWLNLIGRWSISVGTYTLGALFENDIQLTNAPDHFGCVTLRPDFTATFLPTGGNVERPFGGTGNPECEVGRFIMEILCTGSQYSLRIRDREAVLMRTTEQIPIFPLDPALRITARLEKLNPAMEITLDTVVGLPIQAKVSLAAHFKLGKESVSILATHGTPKRPQFVFRDMTSLDQTYKKARFVFGEEVTENSVVIDFNRAVNPPSAFTPYAVCPLPPRENLVPLRIEAGEKRVKAL